MSILVARFFQPSDEAKFAHLVMALVFLSLKIMIVRDVFEAKVSWRILLSVTFVTVDIRRSDAATT